MEEVLRAFGVNKNTLTEVEKTDLEMQGFVCLPNVISEEQILLFSARLEELLEAEGERAGIDAAAAVSTPFDLASSTAILEKGFSRIYQRYFVNLLRESVRRKFRDLPPLFNPGDLKKNKNVTRVR